jgi:hypothetical protein
MPATAHTVRYPNYTFVLTNAKEVDSQAHRLQDIPGRASRFEQILLLFDLISSASVAQHSLVLDVERAIPLIRITYHKATACAPRVEGADFHSTPTAKPNAHLGVVLKVARNKSDGHIYLTLDDANRTITEEEKAERQKRGRSNRGFTSVRLEGICTFEYVDPRVQRRVLERLRARLGPQG